MEEPVETESERTARAEYVLNYEHLRRIHLQSEDTAVVFKVSIGSENLPLSELRHGAKQKINCRPADAPASALVMHLGGSLVVTGAKCRIVERPQIIPQIPESLFLANTRQQFLPHNADQLRSTVADELFEGLGEQPFPPVQVWRFAPQRQRPYRSVHEDQHYRERRRSDL